MAFRIAAGAGLLVLQGDAVAVGQVLDGSREVEVLLLLHETEQLAAGTAAKAVVQLLHRIHGERWRALLVERAATAEVGTSLAQLGVLAHDLDHIGGGLHLVDAGLDDTRHQGRFRG